MTRVAVRFAYDGTRFDSFARQPSRRTTEGELLEALRVAGAIRDARSAFYEVASRTDADVSAWSNVFAIDTDVDPRALASRARTPPGLWLLGATRVAAGFSPRREANARTYRYFMPAMSAGAWKRFRSAARLFVGEHDFKNFCRREPGLSTKRRVHSIRCSSAGGAVWVDITGESFLWEQVRRVVHALGDVASGERTLASVREQLGGAGEPEPPASALPLVLADVDLGLTFPAPSKSLSSRIAREQETARTRALFYDGFPSRRPTTRR